MEGYGFCENGDCRVVLYQLGEDDSGEHYLRRDPVGSQNCPGCGRFGRIKDKASKTRPDDAIETGVLDEQGPLGG